ncbi:MAG: SpoIIE family protein phosphatase [Clostridiales bacterium]|nr:SpoIIE family protein phosphatase [Clostridiales bacterium]
MISSYIKLGIAALLPVIASVLLYIAEKRTSFGETNKTTRQIIYGVVFGILAIIGTEWGIPMNGAQVNCRDAAVLVAGLAFGAPAGIIAGFIGGIERYIAVAWGVGSFTRIACSVSTIIAGIYAALLRKFMFEDKKPSWLLSLAIGVVMEVFHLTMVFITNMATPTRAMEVVKACTVPMLTANGISVMLACMALTLLAKENLRPKKSAIRISQTVQRWLLVAVLLAFLATSMFVIGLQNAIADTQTESLLSIAIDEVSADIEDASDRNMLELTREIKQYMEAADGTEDEIIELAKDKFGISELSIIDSNGIITHCTTKEFVNYDMSSGKQSSEFLRLLGVTEEYVQSYGPISYDTSIMRKYSGIKYGNGFIQIGYDAVKFQNDISEQVVGITKNRHVGSTGYVLILDENMNVVSAPADLEIDSASGYDKTDLPKKDVTFESEVFGIKSYCRYHTSEGYYIVSVLPESEALQMRNIALYVNTFMEILVFAILFALIYLLIKRVVVNKIKNVNSSLSQITNGNLDEVVDVRSNVEFASLSDDINSTVDTLKRYIAEASARIDKELEFAKNIQSSVLPNNSSLSNRKDFDIFASMTPAKEVGGDFYDFYITNGNTLNFLIADVAGKGIPAAMFMMRAKTELKSLTESGLPINDVFTTGNKALCEGNDAGMFVTAWQGCIDLENGVIKYANAGHNPPLVRHENGQFEYLRSRVGFVLAGMDGVNYREQEVRLSRGDVIFLYTDGVTEATNKDNELYGEERLLAAINAQEFCDMHALVKYVKADVDAFVGDAPQFDDLTMVALKYIGTNPSPSISFEKAAISDISAITEFMEAELEKIDCPMKTVIQVNIAIDELYSNIVKYAYPKAPGPAKVELIETSEPHAIKIRFTDDGVPYNPLTKEDPDITLSAEERNIGGLGIFMVKKSMDDMHYEYKDGKNILTITKNL